MLKAAALVACLGVNFYLLAVMVMFATVTYPQLGAAPRDSFPSFYSAFTSRIGAPVVAFEFLALLTTLPLYAARPESVPLWAVHVLVALGIAYFAITFGWHLPVHKTLGTGDNTPPVMATLLRSQWARTAVQLARSGFLGWLAARAMSTGRG